MNRCNLLIYSARNKDKSTVEFVIEIARDFLSFNDNAAPMNHDDPNWMVYTFCRVATASKTINLVVDALCQYCSFAVLEAFELFWSFF